VNFCLPKKNNGTLVQGRKIGWRNVHGGVLYLWGDQVKECE
jgi:hypothetical protein